MDFEIVTIPSERVIESKIFWTKSEREIVELIKKIMQDDPVKLLIFANSRKQCDRLSALLSQNEQIAHHIFTHYSSPFN
jgi:ATP-dependent Lhr-like helicase